MIRNEILINFLAAFFYLFPSLPALFFPFSRLFTKLKYSSLFHNKKHLWYLYGNECLREMLRIWSTVRYMKYSTLIAASSGFSSSKFHLVRGSKYENMKYWRHGSNYHAPVNYKTVATLYANLTDIICLVCTAPGLQNAAMYSGQTRK